MISNYFHTIRYLKFKQIYHRILFKIKKTKIKKTSSFKLRVSENIFSLPIQKNISLIDKDTFHFLNETRSLSKVGWNENDDNISKLWRYNQHYFDYLNSSESSQQKKWHDHLLMDWVNKNNIGEGIGWESYPTSIRIVNWIKWHFLKNTLSKSSIHSLVLQSRWLIKRIEWHILGNHLFTNAKALVFAGLFFSSEESKFWLKKGLEIIDRELNEQVLNDGGNFELSPMYHSIFLEDLLDLINISKVYPKIINQQMIEKWIKISEQMLRWLETMIHPDGQISFFNDSALEIAPSFDKLKNYFERLGLSYNFSQFKRVEHLSDSGYLRVTHDNMVALLDVAKIGPDYIPSHAHADTLSFELSLFGQRLMINGGTSAYEKSALRQYERSTIAHNTVEVNFTNSSQVWGEFRVAKRAYPYDLKIESTTNVTSITCKHDGYKYLKGKPVHSRNWRFFKSSLHIKDIIEGTFKNAYAYFHFNPSVNITKDKFKIWNLKMPNGEKILFKIKEGDAVIEKSYYSIEFGKRLETKCIKVQLDKEEGSQVEILW